MARVENGIDPLLVQPPFHDRDPGRFPGGALDRGEVERAVPYRPPDDAVGGTEGKSILPDEDVRKLRRGRKAPARLGGHPLRVEGGGADHPCEERDALLGALHTPPEVRGQLLEVAVVTHGETLDDGDRRGECTGNRPGFCPHDLGHIRVLLLGHDRGGGAVGVFELDEPDERRAPEDELFTEPARRRHHGRCIGEHLDREVPGGDRVHAVWCRAGETEESRSVGTVEGEPGRGERR